MQAAGGVATKAAEHSRQRNNNGSGTKGPDTGGKQAGKQKKKNRRDNNGGGTKEPSKTAPTDRTAQKKAENSIFCSPHNTVSVRRAYSSACSGSATRMRPQYSQMMIFLP